MATQAEAPRTWLVTGVSSGLGLAFAQAALKAGHTVAGTVRREADRAAFERIRPGRAHAVVLDVSMRERWKNRRWKTCGASSTSTSSVRWR
jgi:NAD(P)-dependent dehydrogenase (short-subunit alcohol dehydrogenase family)